jgi:hypothetical protein
MRDATLPSLSRRFTLLRASSGDTVTLDELKSKLAQQRARGLHVAIRPAICSYCCLDGVRWLAV